eukprot:gb/GFBE01015483.1/.p1 GENE.gb/GFBE01015483.1/~~gb/GFBE01015483.1/.p1  ORF type:complete len:222 (+),score=23.76 gb/GFBE01015483.1/:1-666(+)
MEPGMETRQEMLRTPSGGEYLPHPFPVKRLTAGVGGLGSGFKSLQDPEPRQAFQSYGAWWEARQQIPGPIPPKCDRRATSYWPFGPAVSTLVGHEDKVRGYWLDQRWVDSQVPHTGQNMSSSLSWSRDTMPRRSHSASRLLGSTSEMKIMRDGSLCTLGVPRKQQNEQLAIATSPKARADSMRGGELARSMDEGPPGRRNSNVSQHKLMPEWRVPQSSPGV